LKKKPFSEDDILPKQLNPYSVTKRINELNCIDYCKAYKFSTIVLRLFTVYGPWMRPDLAFYKFALLISQGKPIDVYNFGKMQRDFTYIDDVVAGIISAIKQDLGLEVINIGNDNPEMLDDVVMKLEKYLAKPGQKNYLPIQKGEMASTHADIAKARRLLSYEPRIDIDEGLKKFVEWFKEYHNINQ